MVKGSAKKYNEYKNAANGEEVSTYVFDMNNFLGMGLTAEEVSVKYGVSREDQDEFSLQSHQKAIRAIQEGKFKNQIVPVEVEKVAFDPATNKRVTSTTIIDTDEGPRKDTNL